MAGQPDGIVPSGRREDDGALRMFSRIKLPLSPLRWSRVEAAAPTGKPIVLRFSLLGKRGGPAVASIPNDAIQWESEM